jgi:hypothetical protein
MHDEKAPPAARNCLGCVQFVAPASCKVVEDRSVRAGNVNYLRPSPPKSDLAVGSDQTFQSQLAGSFLEGNGSTAGP